MAHRSSFRSSCEILELEEEELNPLEHYTGVHHPRTEGKDRRSHASNLGRMSSLEDDLSQLFEIFNRRSASQGPVHSPHNGVGLFKKNSSKKSIRAISSSHEYGASEGASLKQAFRGLSISQASQLASAKRSVKSGGSSKAGQMVTAPRDEVKQSLLEISFMPDESDPSGNGANKTMESYEMPKLEAFSAERKTSVQTRPDGPSSVEETLQDEMLYPLSPSSSPILDDNLLRTANSSLADTLMFSATSECASRRSSTEILQKREHADLTREPTKIYPTPYKPMNKGSAKTSTLEDKASAGLPKESHLKKSTNSVSRLVKPVIKTKNFVKRKTKKDTSIAHSEFNNVLYPGSNHIVCPRCQCVLNEEWEEVEEESAFSPGASPSAEQSPVMRPSTELSPLSAESPDNVFSDISNPTFNLDSTNKSQETVGEFTQSSKSSPDESSSSTSISQENNQGRPSSWDRPHMSKDARWQAIRQIRMQHGNVGLKNFNLLKKLGCGDIGTVYLAELIGTNCLFAIKVMDSEFLARRKKIVRAQTEREILRMLDHPFLPTLFSQFTSDNLSCLVMEYCPGGDLHVLRQMQTGRCFTEQATRFYVAEVLLALEYLHMLGVIYRDLKPENILVREDGHIMLSDFDLSLRCAVNPTLLVSPSASDTSKTICVRQPSCQVSCFGPKILKRRNKPRKLKPEPTDLLKPLLQLVAEPTDARSNSFVGTHEYLAPEIIKGEGHGSSVDWWTLGIFLYELLYGRTPFRGSGNEETLANVVLHGLKFPDSPLVSLQARDLIAGLLVKDPENRLGFERGAAEIKQHPFFEGLNWALIRCAVPPELPEFQRIFGAEKGSLNEKLNNGAPANGNNNRYLEFNASTGEHLEFEVF